MTSSIAACDFRSRQRGFTLLEVVFAAGILGTLTFATLQVVVPVAKQARVSRELQLATTEVRKVLEKVQAAPFKDILTLYPDKSTTSAYGLTNGLIRVNYVDATADPLYMQVSLTWDSPDLGPIARTFVTVRTE
jgi:prepilin-type N-terminal cleavage/methylation domain-containing protein